MVKLVAPCLHSGMGAEQLTQQVTKQQTRHCSGTKGQGDWPDSCGRGRKSAAEVGNLGEIIDFFKSLTQGLLASNLTTANQYF